MLNSRRTADLVLTDSGRTLVDTIRPILNDLAEAYFSAFRQRELERLTSDLSRLRAGLAARLG